MIARKENMIDIIAIKRKVNPGNQFTVSAYIVFNINGPNRYMPVTSMI